MLRRQVSPVTGVVTNLAGGGDGPLAGWGARHRAPHASADGSRVPVVRTGGKGVDSASARVAAVCEAVERTALTWPTDVPVTSASLTDLGDDALDPREVMLFSPRQYAAARSRPATSDELPPARADDEPGQTVDDAVIRHRVPVPLRDDDVLDWVPAFPLDGGRAAWVPAALVWFGHRGDGADPHFDSARIVADSNGVAAGATAAEAAVYGLLEVIERDAVAMWWHLRLHRPTVDPDTCDDAYLQGFQAHVTATGRTFWLLDITNDIDVPVFVAVTARADGSEVVFGFGAHLDPVAAARSAVTECAQFLVAFDRNPTDRHGLFGEPGRRWWGTQTLDTDPHLRASGSALWPRDQSGPRDTDDLATLHDRLTAAGLRAYAVDMSRPDVPELTVMRMIVPGARSMFPRFAEGRLFDVPHRLGWTPQRLTEADVNPEEIFF
jgi:ribosomal protein S12 methylthiotransferase accessory factor